MQASSRLSRAIPPLVLLLAVLVFAGTALGWILRHPEVGGYDQIGYADELARDLLAAARGGFGALRDSLFLEARHHPPGARLIGLPLGLAGLADLTSLRLLSFGTVLLTALLIGLTARLAAGWGAAMLAAAAFLLAPTTLFSAEEFLSETLLLPALAGVLWCLAREVVGIGRWGNALLLGAFLGAGALARLSFLPQVAPLLGIALLLVLAFDRPRLGRVAAAALVASLIAWPFYLLNGARYVGYARYALVDWRTHELHGEGPLGFPGHWAWFVADWAFGPFLALALLLGLVALVGVLLRLRRGTPERWPSPGLGVIGCALLLAVPPIVGHYLAINHNPRFLVAALPGLTVAMAASLCLLPWRWPVTLGGGLLAAQAVALAAVYQWPAPTPFAGLRAMQARPMLSCDWRPVVDRVTEPQPHLLLIGQADSFNEVQVSYAFHRLGREASVETLRTTAPWPLVLERAGQAQHVLAIGAADPTDDPVYRSNFRVVPQSATMRLDFVPPELLDRLAEEAGFTGREEIAAPGPGACRAWLLSRGSGPQ